MADMEERPTSKILLPIRVETGVHTGRPAHFLCYDTLLYRPNGYAKAPTKQLVDNDFTKAVLDCLKIYWELETRVDGLMKERDAALHEANVARHDMKLATTRIGELERRCKRSEERMKKAEDRILE